ncbi:DUF2790 domain-containing protein [Pseudomonas chlororaphis]|uniref:DUF2790 domain-containing protein n=1 Tax=Pseudomonas chlororaphis TaxID=587753 RepID=UPI0024087174|nr:DUF2790 domain-containing protein [Pseudomonas chlororaphis]
MGLRPGLTASAAIAANEPAAPVRGTQDLDIAKVLSVSPTSTACDVVPATMVYIDHQGRIDSLTYQVRGTCSGV